MQCPHMLHQNNGIVRPLKRCFVLCFSAGYVQNIIQQYESTTVWKEPLHQSSYYENCVPQNQHFSWWAKMNETQRRALLSPWRVHFMNSGTSKGTFRDEATSNNKKNQAHRLSHYWVTLVWRHQLISWLGS